jgi:hypothetical protein
MNMLTIMKMTAIRPIIMPTRTEDEDSVSWVVVVVGVANGLSAVLAVVPVLVLTVAGLVQIVV